MSSLDDGFIRCELHQVNSAGQSCATLARQ
jgi:hypothetical protein